METKQLNEEIKFLETVKELSTKYLFEASIKSNDFPEGFDIAKALLVLDRVIDSEIDFLEREPEDYLDIYD